MSASLGCLVPIALPPTPDYGFLLIPFPKSGYLRTFSPALGSKICSAIHKFAHLPQHVLGSMCAVVGGEDWIHNGGNDTEIMSPDVPDSSGNPQRA